MVVCCGPGREGVGLLVETVDLAIIALYFLGSLGVGYWASRQIKSADDFAVAGGHLKFPVLLGTLIATAIGASATMGRAGKAYEVGIAIFLAGIAYAVGLYLFSYLAPILKRMGIWSVPQALHLRYGRAFRVVAAVIIIIALVGIYGAQLIAFGVVVVSLLPESGVSYEQAVIVAAIIMVVYTTLGGLLAVAYTDLVQAIIMIIAVGIILPVLVVMDMGGPQVAINHLAPPAGDWLGGMTVVYMLSIFLIDIPVSLLDVSLWQRTGASKNVRHIQSGVRITAIAFVVWSFIVVSLGIFASHLLPGLEDTPAGSDGAVPMLVIQYMPPVIKGLCLAALLAIIMSTADTVLLIGGTTMSWDIVSQFRSDTDSETKIRIARWTVVVSGAIGALFAIYVRDVFEVLLLAFAIYVSALFVPTMLAIFWKKATTAGAMTSAVAAFLSVTSLYLLKFKGQLSELIEPVVVSLILSLVVMVVVSLVTSDKGAPTERLIDRTGG